MRITIKDLQILTNRLNTVTNSPVEYGNNHFYIDYCIGGCRLCRICETGSGAYDMSPRVGARELYDIIQGVLKGLEIAFPCKYSEYHRNQFSRLKGRKSIKIFSDSESTNQMDISDTDFQKIAKILGGE